MLRQGQQVTHFLFSETPCPKSKENPKKRKEKIKILMNKETKTTQFPSETEDSTTIQTANKTKPKFSLKTESP
jgi:hypothetical protein